MWHGHAREIPLLIGRVKEPEDTRGIQATLRPLREKKAKANNTWAFSCAFRNAKSVRARARIDDATWSLHPAHDAKRLE